MNYYRSTELLGGRVVWVVEMENSAKEGTLLLSKMSEAVQPGTPNNHVGEGGTFDDFLCKQENVKFIINGGFNHYRKRFYVWPHDDFKIGDPVGIVKIRDHYYEDVLDPSPYGFFVQEAKGLPWKVVRMGDVSKEEKYILGCTPLMVFKGEGVSLSMEAMVSRQDGSITPPSVLWHGLECHPRSAVGVRGGSLVFVVVEGPGCTLLELQEVGVALGLDAFLNLDGGGSSQFRLKDGGRWVGNVVAEKDRSRVIGNAIVLFGSGGWVPQYAKSKKLPGGS